MYDESQDLREQNANLERQLAEAQGKLDAVDEWQEDWDGVGTIDWTALSRILKEGNDG